MKKELLLGAAGWSVLGLVMALGAMLVWNARATIAWNVAEKEDAKKPAEIELVLIVPAKCDACVDGTLLMEAIEKQDVRVLSSKTLTADSADGLTLIETYGLTRAPIVLVRGEFEKEIVHEAFSSLGGEKNEDGTLVLQATQPVYLDLTSNEVVGLVDATYITDSGCAECYDPAQHKTILESAFGVTLQNERTVDAWSQEGRALVSQYAITQIPTLLLSPQALAYDRLTATWQKVGSVEEDGVYVFRKNAAMGSVTYHDLMTGKTIRPNSSDE